MSKPAVAVFCDTFLTRQMTFIYGQLRRLCRFEPVVIARHRLNEDLFPWEGVTAAPARSAAERVSRGLKQRLGIFPGPTRREVAVWCRRLTETRPALIHAQFGPGGLDMLPVARKLGLPLVVTFHGFGASQLLLNPGYRRKLPRLFHDASRILCVCAPMLDRLAECGCERSLMQVLHLGVDTSRFGFCERSEPRPMEVLQVCGLVEKKGVEHSLRAFRMFLDGGGEGRLTLAGDGPLREKLLRLAEDLSLGEAFVFLGPVDHDEVPELMSRASVFLHPSVTAADGDREGLPTAVAEAMATGLPVISTRHEGIPELVRDGVDGFLPEERDEGAIRDALFKLSDAGRRRDMGRSAAERVRSCFDQETQVAELERVYAEIADAATE